MDGTGLPVDVSFDGLFTRYATCPPLCAGHADPSNLREHATDLDRFGENGPVVVTQIDGEDPKVSLLETERVQTDYDPDEAERVAWQLLAAAHFARTAALASAI